MAEEIIWLSEYDPPVSRTCFLFFPPEWVIIFDEKNRSRFRA